MGVESMLMIFIDIIAWIISIGIILWVGIFILKIFLSNYKKQKRKTKEVMKIINIVEKKVKSFYNYFFFILGMLLKMILSTILAIGSKPIILKLNPSLGEGYAMFASYIVAIGLFVALPNFWKLKEQTEIHGSRKVLKK